MEPTNRPCEICGHSDLDSYVVSSTLGGFSQNVCVCCNAMGAEATSFSKEYKSNSYNSNDDMYYDSSDNHLSILLKSGVKLNTRSEAVNYITGK